MDFLIYISLICSLIYWITSHCHYFYKFIPETLVAKINFLRVYRVIPKVLAILCLMPESAVNKYILLFYCFGDMVMTFKEIEPAIFFFDVGHLLLLLTSYPFGTINSMVLFILLMCVSVSITVRYFPPDIPYKIHIIVLHLLFYYALVTGHYFIICFIISDLLIGLKIYKPLTWPLYYYAVFCLTH